MKSVMWSFYKKKKKSLSDALVKTSLFENLDKREIRKIAKIAHIRNYKDDEVIFKKDEPAYGLFIVLKGRVEIFLHHKRSKVVLGNYKIHEYFGEFSLVDEHRRTASALAERDSILCYIFKEDLKILFDSDPKLGIKIYRSLTQLLVEKVKNADELLAKQNDTKRK